MYLKIAQTLALARLIEHLRVETRAEWRPAYFENLYLTQKFVIPACAGMTMLFCLTD